MTLFRGRQEKTEAGWQLGGMSNVVVVFLARPGDLYSYGQSSPPNGAIQPASCREPRQHEGVDRFAGSEE